jgi:hypothetical protein
MNDFYYTVDLIRSALANKEYNDRFPYFIEARRRVLEEYNLFALLGREITLRDRNIKKQPEGVIMDRSVLKNSRPLSGLQREIEKIYIKMKHIR